MKRPVGAIAAGVALALLVFFVRTDRAWEGLLFRLHLFNRAAEIREIKETVSVFNIYYSRFFSSAGDTEGLNLFPADNLIKRRVIQEINTWRNQGSALVYDRYSFDVKETELLSPFRAVVLTDETWALLLRNLSTGKKSEGMKTLHCRYRYLLGKFNNKWKVLEYDVFNMQDILPPVPESWKR